MISLDLTNKFRKKLTSLWIKMGKGNNINLLFLILCILVPVGVCTDTSVIYLSILEKKDPLVTRIAKDVTS